jgi:hypothetical protein
MDWNFMFSQLFQLVLPTENIYKQHIEETIKVICYEVGWLKQTLELVSACILHCRSDLKVSF